MKGWNADMITKEAANQMFSAHLRAPSRHGTVAEWEPTLLSPAAGAGTADSGCHGLTQPEIYLAYIEGNPIAVWKGTVRDLPGDGQQFSADSPDDRSALRLP